MLNRFTTDYLETLSVADFRPTAKVSGRLASYDGLLMEAVGLSLPVGTICEIGGGSANDTGARRLVAMIGEFGLTSLDALARHILGQSEKGARAAIAALPEGAWSYEMPLDGYEREIVIRSKLTIAGGKVTIDFSGSSPASIHGTICAFSAGGSAPASGIRITASSRFKSSPIGPRRTSAKLMSVRSPA